MSQMTQAWMELVLNPLSRLGRIALFIGTVFKNTELESYRLSQIFTQTHRIILMSLPTVAVSGIFVGAILVIQFSMILAKFDALTYLGGLNTSAIVREIGPLLISCLLAGRIGAFTASELGSMKVSDQIDAIRCLGGDPIKELIVPRFFGIVTASAVLLLIGILIAVLSSMGAAQLLVGLNPLQYAGSFPKFASLSTIGIGLFKSVSYGFLVAAVACEAGYATEGGAREVGQAVTETAVFTNFLLVLANFFTSEVLSLFEALLRPWSGFGGAG